MKLDKLTPAQIAKFPEYVREWVDIGLRTGPIDRATFERAARACYRHAKLAEPSFVIAVDSPLATALAPSYARALLDALRPGGKVRSQVGSQVWSQVESQVRSQVESQVESQVRSQVRSQVESQVWSQVWSQVESQVWSQVGSQVESDLNNCIGGQFWASWHAYSSFFESETDVLGEALSECSRDYADAARSACWWSPHREFVIACQRPVAIHRDDDGRLHSETGMAIYWPDGWGLYMWHGVSVPRGIIERPEQITVEQIKAERNAEVRRIMRERYGDSRYLVDIGAKVIDADTVAVDRLAPRSKHIHRALMSDDEGNRWLVGSDGSTRRTYLMRVPNDIETCSQAHSALANGLLEKDCILQA